GDRRGSRGRRSRSCRRPPRPRPRSSPGCCRGRSGRRPCGRPAAGPAASARCSAAAHRGGIIAGPASALLGEDRVDPAPSLVDQLADATLLILVGSVEDLPYRLMELAHRDAELDLLRVGLRANGIPGGLLAGLRLLLGAA